MKPYNWNLHDATVDALRELDKSFDQINSDAPVPLSTFKDWALAAAFNARASKNECDRAYDGMKDLDKTIAGRILGAVRKGGILASMVTNHIKTVIEHCPQEQSTIDRMTRDRLLRLQYLQELNVQVVPTMPIFRGETNSFSDYHTTLKNFLLSARRIDETHRDIAAPFMQDKTARPSVSDLKISLGKVTAAGLDLASQQVDLAKDCLSMASTLLVIKNYPKPIQVTPDLDKRLNDYMTLAMEMSRAARFNLAVAREDVSLQYLMDNLERPVFLYALPRGGNVRSGPAMPPARTLPSP
ncbi:hypothetical protein [Micavibrio aeruginosavorus]|uniref:Uncharacterized protein n=1 Tax=Micavibrio aeruginosavorus EPB TaxID=349215 RepID=M4VHY1_9BACT|nr:hypothetical protein [Micavibrio aeruginosavorus]AGH98813.1 hypothetical protein A11S_2013 [Micavibrio aeruginosavorus EPB]